MNLRRLQMVGGGMRTLKWSYAVTYRSRLVVMVSLR